MRRRAADRWGPVAVLMLLLGAGLAGAPAVLRAAPAAVQIELPATTEVLQPQALSWAPVGEPRLAFELTDRRSRSRVAVVAPGSSVVAQLLPARQSSQMERLGLGTEPTDTAPSWSSDGSLFFLRAEGRQRVVAHFDGAVRRLALPPEWLPMEVASLGEELVLAAEDPKGTDLIALHPREPESPRRLTSSRDEVEHSVVVDGGRLGWIATSRERTAWCAGTSPDDRACTEFPELELLSLAVAGGPAGTRLAYARLRTGDSLGRHALVELGPAGRWRLLAEDVFLPAGLAPSPAWDPVGGAVYFVRRAPESGNPIVRLDPRTGARRELVLPTVAHQEVAVGRYEKGTGTELWLALIAVGDRLDRDVYNHVVVVRLGEGMR